MNNICALEGCSNNVRKSKNTGKLLQHCSRQCQNTDTSRKSRAKASKTAKCRSHNERKNISNKTKKTKLQRYGSETFVNPDLAAITKLEKYGDQNFNNRDKFRQTMDNKSVGEKEQIVKNRQLTAMSKYGVDSFSKTAEFKEKYSATCLEKYGVDNAAKSEEVINKIKNTMYEKYGMHYNQTHIPNKILKILMNKKLFVEYATGKSRVAIANKLDVDVTTIVKYIEKYDCENVLVNIASYPEQLLYEFIQENYNTEIIRNSRKIIKPLELDIYLPKYKLAIEFNGIYYHRPDKYGGKDQWFQYHKNKITDCKEKGINLLHLWENYGNHDDLVKNAMNGNIDNNLGEIYEDIYK